MAANTIGEYDKIQVLLLDDNPKGMQGSSGCPQMVDDLSPWFDFRWVATPEEAREYGDRSWAIAQHRPSVLGARGWLSEILIIDYAMTGETGSVAERVGHDSDLLNRMSPLPTLRALSESVLPESGLTSLDFDDSFDRSPPVLGEDFWGCFLGGFLLSTFAAQHPCAPVTITKFDQSAMEDHAQSLDAAFFEWLLHNQSSGSLHADGTGGSPSWDQVLPLGAARLRERIAHMIQTRVIVPSWSDLKALATDGLHEVLTVHTRFGRRRYPTAGLFIDVSNEPERKESAESWARDILESIVPPEVDEAMRIADQLWEVYSALPGSQFDKMKSNRRRLSELLASGDVTDELESLRKEFEVGETARVGCRRCFELRVASDRRARRWSAILVAFKLAVFAARLKRKTSRVARDARDPKIIESDFWFAMFPVPKLPFILPPIKKGRPYRDNNWEAELSRCGLSMPDIMKGRPSEGGFSGLTQIERHVLQMLAADERDRYANDAIGEKKKDETALRDSWLGQCELSRKIIWGE